MSYSSSSQQPSAKRTKRTSESIITLQRRLDTEVHVCSMAFSSNGLFLASASFFGFISIWDVLNGVLQLKFKIPMDWIHVLVYTHDYKYIITGSNSSSIDIWDVSTGMLESKLQGHTSAVDTLVINEDGKLLCSGSWDCTIRVWNLDNKICLVVLTGHTGYVNSLAITPGFIISGSADGTIKCWSRRTGECNPTIKASDRWVLATASHTNPDGSFLFASGSRDKTINLYDDILSSRPRTLIGHANSVTSISFNKDGSLLASGSDDKTVKIWDVSSGICIQTLVDHSSTVQSIVFSPDGSRLVSGSEDGKIFVWNVTYEL